MQFKQLENSSNKDYDSIKSSILFDFFYNTLDIDLKRDIYKLYLKPNGEKSYFKTNFNSGKPSYSPYNKKDIYTYFQPKNLKTYFIKDYKTNKSLQNTVTLLCDTKDKSGTYVYEKKELRKAKAKESYVNILTNLLANDIIPFYKNYMTQGYRLNHNNYACHAKKNSKVVRVDIDSHNKDEWDFHISHSEVLDKITKHIVNTLPVIYGEKSVNDTGLHFYLKTNNQKSYDENKEVIKFFIQERIDKILSNLEIPEAKEFFKPDTLTKDQILALPFNSQYEPLDFKGNTITNFEYYKTVLPYTHKNQKLKIDLFNIVDRLKARKPEIEKEVEPKTFINETGWTAGRTNQRNWKDIHLERGTRVENTKELIYALIHDKKEYSFDEFIDIVIHQATTSYDIETWTREQLEKNYSSFYELYLKLKENIPTHSDRFNSNIYLLTDSINRKIKRIVKKISYKEGIGKRNKGQDRKNKESEILELLTKEVIGYLIYVATNDRSKIKKNGKLSKQNRLIAEENFQIGRKWLFLFKEFYDIENIDVERLFKLLLKHNVLEYKEFVNKETGHKSKYLCTDKIKIASTYNLNYSGILCNSTMDIDSTEEGIRFGLDSIIGKYFIMREECVPDTSTTDTFKEDSTPVEPEYDMVELVKQMVGLIPD